MKDINVLNALIKNEQNAEASVEMVEVDKETLRQLSGGAMDKSFTSSGYFCTISGECNADGSSCWPF